MEQIKKIELTDFKKHENLALYLNQPTFLIGNNGSGKSSVIQGIVFATLGYVPGVDKKDGIARIIKNDTDAMAVELSASDGTNQVIRRTLTKSGTSTKQELYVNFSRNKTLAKLNQDIESKFHIKNEFFDMNNFLNMSSSEKSDLIYNLINSDLGKGYMEEYLDKKLGDKVLVESIISYYSDSMSISENVDKILDVYGNLKKELKKEVDELSATGIQLSSSLSDVEYKDLTDTINQKNAELRELETKLQGIKTANTKYSITLSKLQAAKGSYAVSITTMEKLEAENDNLQKQINSLSAVTVKPNNYVSDMKALENELRKEQDNYNDVVKNGKAIAELINNDKALIDKINNLSKTHKCLVDDSIICENSKGFSSALADFNNKLKKNVADRKVLATKYYEYKDRIAEIRKKKDKVLADMEKADNLVKENQHKINFLRKQIQDNENKIKEINTKTTEIKSLEYSLNNMAPITDTKVLEKLVSAKMNEISKLSMQQKDNMKNKEHIIIMEQNSKNLSSKKDKLKESKEVEAVLKQFKLDLVNIGIGPFVNTMNEVLAKLQLDKTVFVDTFKKKVLFGFVDAEGRKKEFSCLSTGESLIFLLALVAAIYSLDDECFKFFAMDNLDCLDDNNLFRILEHIDVLKEYFDNILLAGVIAPEKLKAYKDSRKIQVVDFGSVIEKLPNGNSLLDTFKNKKREPLKINYFHELDYMDDDSSNQLSFISDMYIDEETQKMYRTDLILKRK